MNVSKRFKNKNTNHRPTILFNFKDPVPLLQVSQQLCLRLPFLLTPPYFPPAIFALPSTLSACTSFTPKLSFSAYGPHIWNTLPLSLRLKPFLSSFQSALKTSRLTSISTSNNFFPCLYQGPVSQASSA